MSNVPGDLKYSESHEWLRLDGGGVARIGITDHAQAQLGDLVFVELPEVGSAYAQGDECGVIESVKTASDLYAPLTGEVVAVNSALEETPEMVNEDPYEDGWIFELKLDETDQFDGLMDAETYLASLDE